MTGQPQPPQPDPARVRSTDELHSDWAWFRPTFTFLRGLLVGTDSQKHFAADLATCRP